MLAKCEEEAEATTWLEEGAHATDDISQLLATVDGGARSKGKEGEEPTQYSGSPAGSPVLGAQGHCPQQETEGQRLEIHPTRRRGSWTSDAEELIPYGSWSGSGRHLQVFGWFWTWCFWFGRGWKTFQPQNDLGFLKVFPCFPLNLSLGPLVGPSRPFSFVISLCREKRSQ